MTRAQVLHNEAAQHATEGGEDARLIDRFTERPEQRAARIARKRIDPDTAAALRRLFAA